MLDSRSISWIVLTVILFVLLTPGVLVVIPPFRLTEVKWTATDPLSLLPLLVHGTLFAVILLSFKKYVKREQKVAKATGQSLIKTIATNVTKNIKNVASKVTGGIVASTSPAPTVSPASATTTTTPTTPTTPSKPVTTPVTTPTTTPTRPVATPTTTPTTSPK
jgi:hypothetical protein